MGTAVAGLLQLTRPFNCLIALLSVLVGGFSAGALWLDRQLVVAGLSAALVMAAGNALNDLRDIDIDRINKPLRPLPSGVISPSAATAATLVLACAGLAAAWGVGTWTGLIASGAIALLTAYSLWLKSTVLWGNLVVSLLGGAAFPYGAIATGSWGRSWIPAGFAILLHFGREIVKDLEDVRGDVMGGVRTLPVRNPRSAVITASIVLVLLIPLTLYPYLIGAYGWAYLLLVLPVDGLVAIGVWRMWWGYRLHHQVPTISPSLKAAMVLGLVAILAGEIY